MVEALICVYVCDMGTLTSYFPLVSTELFCYTIWSVRWSHTDVTKQWYLEHLMHILLINEKEGIFGSLDLNYRT